MGPDYFSKNFKFKTYLMLKLIFSAYKK
jgi:hypothetical protein